MAPADLAIIDVFLSSDFPVVSGSRRLRSLQAISAPRERNERTVTE
jgi:hypothetical protein